MGISCEITEKDYFEGTFEMFERIDYVVKRIDGDYAYLLKADDIKADEKCVARALLPPEIMEGKTVIYEMLQYRMEEI